MKWHNTYINGKKSGITGSLNQMRNGGVVEMSARLI
jgi:hypothetical protein